MALAQIHEIQAKKLVERGAELGLSLLRALLTLDPRPSALTASVRGAGLLVGVELRLLDGAPATEAALRIVKSLLHRGFILLPEGEHANVISFTPPLTISKQQLLDAVEMLKEVLVTP
jgi:4-aminobutyrate aminotransferase-like enzyme